ncbi:hypothetical protein NDU88_007832 [Pleurodeles waltl]|uniref:Protein very KIND n=2 Tax=Pleurodeles waltl TaxID=8319 RepID=A0AAV7QPY3_PLEWA|nr:hypothetical protein NDU88_007832 [Pleurodeles waltl]
MEPLSDDPEGDFVPPEFDITGNTLEAHVYSLGATLKAAIEYVVEPELEQEISRDLWILLENMQDPIPSNRPDIESIISLCEERMDYCSSLNICRRLSAVGRRVLSIESVAAFQDGCEYSWKGKLPQGINSLSKERNSARALSVANDSKSSSFYSNCVNEQEECDLKEMGINDERTCHLQFGTLSKKSDTDMDDSGVYNFNKGKVCVKESCPPKVQREYECKKSVLDTKNTSAFQSNVTTISRKNMLPRRDVLFSSCSQEEEEYSDFNELQLDQPNISRSSFILNEIHEGNDLGVQMASTVDQKIVTSDNENVDSLPHNTQLSKSFVVWERIDEPPTDNEMITQNYAILENSVQTLTPSDHTSASLMNEKTLPLCVSPRRIKHGASHANPRGAGNSPRGINEDTYKKCWMSKRTSEHEQWTSLKDLLRWHGEPLTECELWALCQECLFTLQTFIDFPAYLSFDSVVIDSQGEILFVAPKEEGGNDTFCVPPEFGEQGFVTEKACVYGVAAILWTAAKCNCSIQEKLTLPKKLKRLLLSMAKRDYKERPSLDDALKMCREYLILQNLSSKHILAELSKCARQVQRSKDECPEDFVEVEDKDDAEQFPKSNCGFVPISSDRRLTAVKGPVPCQLFSHNVPSKLPNTFTSPATYFKPIILLQNAENGRNKKVCEASSMTHTPENENQERIVGKRDSIALNDIESHALDEQPKKTDPVIHEEFKTSKCGPTKSLPIATERQLFNNSVSSATHSISTSDYVSDMKENVSSTASSCSSAGSTLSTTPLVNNFLIKQDPKTGVLKLVPVQLEIPDEMPSVHLQTEKASGCLHKSHVHFPGNLKNDGFEISIQSECCNIQTGDTVHGRQPGDLHTPHISCDECSNVPLDPTYPEITGKCKTTEEMVEESNNAVVLSTRSSYDSAGANSSSFADFECSPQLNRSICTPLQKVVNCIQDEFAFDGYLENGVEDLAMGEYIFALKGLQFATFRDAVSEKFCDLYWDDKLLRTLYKEINGKSPTIISTDKDDPALSSISRSFRKKYTRRKSKDKKQDKCAYETNLNSVANEETLHIPPEQPTPPDLHGVITAGTGGTNVQSGPTTDASAEDVDSLSLVTVEKDLPHQRLDSRNGVPLVGGHDLFGNSHCPRPDFTENDDPDDPVKGSIENRPAMSPAPSAFCRVCPGWSSAFYGTMAFNSSVQRYMQNLGGQRSNDVHDFESKRLELEQQLMFETKNYRKTLNFYRKLLQKENMTRGPDGKTMLSKLKDQLEEMKSKVLFLEMVKKCLQVTYEEQWGLEISTLPTIANITTHREEEELSPSKDSSMPIFYNIKEWQSDNHNISRILQAGTPRGLMAYLYASNAVSEGYVQQFLYTFRYFCTQEEFLQFLIERIDCSISSESMDPSAMVTKIYNRSMYLLQTWIEDCCNVDFTANTNLVNNLEEYISCKIIPNDSYGEHLLSLLQDLTSHKYSSVSPGSSLNGRRDEEETKSLYSFCFKVSEDNISRKSFSWKIPKGNGPLTLYQKDKQYTVPSALPRPCYTSDIDEFSGSYVKAEERVSYIFSDYSVHQISQQLTLLQEELFKNCHPVHFLNSRSSGVEAKPSSVLKSFLTESLTVDGCSLFQPNCIQNKYLVHVLRFVENVSAWVAAEIVSSHNLKLQANLLSTFLLIGKSCYEHRDFGTAMQILGGLDNLIVRQLPAWKNLPSKVSEILDELKAVEVFLKSDNLCLMEGDRFKTLPTIPSAHVLAMHVQQLETGGFTMANGAYKWKKLR